VDQAQGFFYARPAPPEDLVQRAVRPGRAARTRRVTTPDEAPSPTEVNDVQKAQSET